LVFLKAGLFSRELLEKPKEENIWDMEVQSLTSGRKESGFGRVNSVTHPDRLISGLTFERLLILAEGLCL